jgi:hypothetical protein
MGTGRGYILLIICGRFVLARSVARRGSEDGQAGNLPHWLKTTNCGDFGPILRRSFAGIRLILLPFYSWRNACNEISVNVDEGAEYA